MRLKRYLALLGLCAVAQGCTPLKNVAETVICEPAAYCLGMDDFVSCCRNRHLADEAWYHFQSALPDCQYSDDFADGFKTGFADFLYAGGNGDPPVVPPRSYWRPTYETPQGQLMMQDWFRGYRHGTAVARESGYREAVVVPASIGLPPIVEPTPPTAFRPLPMPRADEILPAPKGAGDAKQPPQGQGASGPAVTPRSWPSPSTVSTPGTAPPVNGPPALTPPAGPNSGPR